MTSDRDKNDFGPISEAKIERMLQTVLAPVDPPPRLYQRLERIEDSLERRVEAATEELSDWELAAMRDPRNWVKPAVALAAGAAAAGGLVVLGLRSRRRDDKAAKALRSLGDALGDVRREVERSAKRAVS